MKSRIIESFGLQSAGSRPHKGRVVSARGLKFHRRRAKEMIKAIQNESKEKERFSSQNKSLSNGTIEHSETVENGVKITANS